MLYKYILGIKWYVRVGINTSKRKDSCFPMGCADAAAVDGRRGSNVYDNNIAYEVNVWVSTIYFSPFFTGFFSRRVFLHFSHEFSREFFFSRKFLSIFLLNFSRDLSNSFNFSRLFLCTFLSTVPKISDFQRLKA